MTGCWIYAEIRNPSAVAVVRAVIGKKQALRKGAFFVFLAGIAGVQSDHMTGSGIQDSHERNSVG
jgi:hypothetical protein